MTTLGAIEMMRCARRDLTLSTRGCSKLWLSANGEEEPQPWASNHLCLRCPVGAEMAGGNVNPIDQARADLRPLCPRCRRISDRMIHSKSLPGHPTLCISCTNRGLECVRRRVRPDGQIQIGVNGKGGRPGLLDRLHDVTLLVTDVTGAERAVMVPTCTGIPEAVLRIAREAMGPLRFARPRPAMCARLAVAEADADVGEDEDC